MVSIFRGRDSTGSYYVQSTDGTSAKRGYTKFYYITGNKTSRLRAKNKAMKEKKGGKPEMGTLMKKDISSDSRAEKKINDRNKVIEEKKYRVTYRKPFKFS